MSISSVRKQQYNKQFAELVTSKTNELRERGYVPLIGSEVEVLYETLSLSEANKKRNSFYNTIVLPEATRKLDGMQPIPGDWTKSALEKELVIAEKFPLEKLMAFYLHKVHAETSKILEPPTNGKYEDEPGSYEFRLKATTPDQWCKNYRNFIKVLHQQYDDTGLKPTSYNQHYHTSLHGLEATAPLPDILTDLPNLCKPDHKDYFTTGARILELQLKAMHDGAFFLFGPDKLRHPSKKSGMSVAQPYLAALPIKGSTMRTTDRSFEIRAHPLLNNMSPEIMALLFCLSPMLCAIDPKTDGIAPDAIRAERIIKFVPPKSATHDALRSFLNSVVFFPETSKFIAGEAGVMDAVNWLAPMLKDLGVNFEQRGYPGVTAEDLVEYATVGTNEDMTTAARILYPFAPYVAQYLRDAVMANPPNKGSDTLEIQWPDKQLITGTGNGQITFGELFANSKDIRKTLGQIKLVPALAIKHEKKLGFVASYETYANPILSESSLSKEQMDKEVNAQLDERISKSDIFQTALGNNAVESIVKYGRHL